MSATWSERRSELRTYFDRTAVEAWARLTSDAPVSRIRATVRAGRDAMRATLLEWLPADMRSQRLLDAGCGTGMLALEAARRDAQVAAIDISPTLVQLGRDRTAGMHGAGQVAFHVGDMLDPAFGQFDHVVAMDSLIHYHAPEVVRALARWAGRTRCSILFTFAPRTPLLAAMHAVGRLFPRGDRAPAVEPVSEATLRRLIAAEPGLAGWRIDRTHRVATGFYISQGVRLVRG
jgi:magnesium-protoporphyrin O-methyltransferase